MTPGFPDDQEEVDAGETHTDSEITAKWCISI